MVRRVTGTKAPLTLTDLLLADEPIYADDPILLTRRAGEKRKLRDSIDQGRRKAAKTGEGRSFRTTHMLTNYAPKLRKPAGRK